MTLTLPKQRSMRQSDVNAFTHLCYGSAGIGKSTFCAGLPDVCFLPTEPGLESLEVWKIPEDRPCLSSWEEPGQAAALLAKGGHPFKAIVLDTVDEAYQLCADYVCRKFKVSHISEIPDNRGYSYTTAEFRRVVHKLASLPYGLYLIAHRKEVEVKTRSGKHTRYQPTTLSQRPMDWLVGFVDTILFVDLEEGEEDVRRVIRTRPALHYHAKDRTGQLPPLLELDAHAFLACYTRKPSQKATP